MTLHLDEPPIFIVGAGRSGTTLLQSLLSAHSRIAVTPETHFCAIAGQIVGRSIAERGIGASEFEALWSGYLASKRFADLSVDPDRCRVILERSPERSPRAALAALMTAYGETQRKPRVGEKTPGHWRYAPTLLEWFPEARVVLMRRDPRAVVSSKMKAAWAQRYMRFAGTALRRLTRLHVVAAEARHWVRIYRDAAPGLLRDPRVMPMSYEDLVRDPEAGLRAVCDHLGEAFEPDMLGDRSAQAAAVGTGTRGEWGEWRDRHLEASRRPVNDASLEKWRGDLSARETAVMEAIAGPVMERLGYALTSAPAARRAARGLAAVAVGAGTAELGARWVLGRGLGAAKGVLRPRPTASPR